MLDIDSPYEAGPPSLLWRARTALAEVDSRTGAAVFGLLLALAAAVGADRALVRAGEINLRIELLFGVLISVCAVAYLRRQALKVVGYLDWLLLGWVGLNIMASLAFSPSPIDSVRAALVLPGLFAIYLAVNLLVRGMGAANLAALLFVCVGAAVSLVGLVGSILFTLTGATGGISLHRVYEGDVLTVVPLVSSTIWEPNLFGALALCTGLLAGALTFAPSHEQQRGRTVLLTCVALCYAGAVLSMTRTVWLVGLMLTLALATVQPILSARKGALYRPIWLATALVGVIVGAAAAASMPRVAWKTADPWELAYDQLEERVTLEVLNLGSGTKGVLARNSALAGRVDELAEWENAPTILARQSANRQAIELWKERPWFGWGTDAFRHVASPEAHAPSWIPNVALHVLFDTGIAGAVLMGLAWMSAAVMTVRALARPVVTWQLSEFTLLGLAFGAGALAICFQMTDGTWMGFSWFALALLVVSARHSLARRP